MFHKYESMMSMVKTEVDILMDNNFEREENTTSDACKSKETEEYQENLRHDDDFWVWIRTWQMQTMED